VLKKHTTGGKGRIKTGRPKLTTVAFPKQALGEQAVLRLISHIEGGKQPPAVHMLAPELVIRQSTKRVTEKNVR
jgi:DNA-binding LacI/PurR family transcriptional regulator